MPVSMAALADDLAAESAELRFAGLDETLEITGPHAREWMEIGQAFAGAPGTGRKPGVGGGAA